MNRLSARILLCVISLFLCTSCASIINGKTQKINITTEPKGASVIVDGETVGETPLEVELERKKDHEIILTKDGFILEVITLKRKISPVVLAYILPGGLLSFGIDAIDGCQFTLGPNELHIPLHPKYEGNSSLASYFLKKLGLSNKNKDTSTDHSSS